jgi:hypothetical protein
MRHEDDYPSCIHDHIHPCTKEEEEEEATFARYKTSHMETDHEEKKAPNMTMNPSSAVDHSSDHREELVEPEGPTHNQCSNQEETSMVP